MKPFFPFALLLLLATGLQAQTPIPIQFLQDSTRNTTIATLPQYGRQYVSLNDLVRAFNLRAQKDSEALKIDVQTPAFTMRATAGSPYIVVLDQKNNANIAQMPFNVLYVSNTFFVPFESFLPVLRSGLNEEIAYDGTVIRVGKPRPPSAFDVTGVTFEEKSNGYLIRILCSKKIPDYESWPKQIGDNTWLYVTLANARANVEAISRIQPTGFVKQILVFQSPTAVQLTFKLKGEVTGTEPLTAENSNDILLAIHTPTPEEIAARKERDYGHTLQKERDKWKLDVVVIDAGHGGNDPGTIGVNKTKEKDVTLGIALRLGKLIQKSIPKVKVVYTRDNDTFIELYRRGQIANQNAGKLFISIHCNSMPHKPNPESGFEIYLLRPGKTENALRIAERENAVVKLEQGYEERYQQLTEENFILLAMAQSAYVKYSEEFSNILQKEMSKTSEMSNNGVKQAGFYVLVGASMPNVLVETGYLSNRHDEKILKSVKGQERIAGAICNAIKRYKQEYEKSLNEGKELGTN